MPIDVSVMGIVNVTDDSFYEKSRTLDGGRYSGLSALIEKHISEGADILDFGACSTRPGSQYVEMEEEWRRLEPALRQLKKTYPEFPFSIDTFRSEIVRRVHDEFGSFMVNDISAGEEDDNMLPLTGQLGLRYVAMHKRGTPSTMQSMCDYGDVVEDVLEYFRQFAVKAEKAGVKNWILDPGFGFAKSVEQNYQLLDNIHRFCEAGCDVLIGISRKSFIYKPLGLTPEQSLAATTRLHRQVVERMMAAIGDVNQRLWLRVHDCLPVSALK